MSSTRADRGDGVMVGAASHRRRLAPRPRRHARVARRRRRPSRRRRRRTPRTPRTSPRTPRIPRKTTRAKKDDKDAKKDDKKSDKKVNSEKDAKAKVLTGAVEPRSFDPRPCGPVPSNSHVAGSTGRGGPGRRRADVTCRGRGFRSARDGETSPHPTNRPLPNSPRGPPALRRQLWSGSCGRRYSRDPI